MGAEEGMMENGSRVVLLVDDDVDVREALIAWVEQHGFAAIAASDGQNALALLRAGLRPNVILLDLHMPVCDGWRFREEQMRDSRLADVPVVMFSCDRIDRQRAARLGIRECLQKPLALDRLTETLGRHCAA
jgi:CheY-like chemotaxis protein